MDISIKEKGTAAMAMASSPIRKPELRKDAVTNRWVIISPARARRPLDFKSKSPTTTANPNQQCPFCIGHEDECAPEIFRVPAHNSDLSWSIRVIQNLYPALDRHLPIPPTSGRGCRDSDSVIGGFGFHDVVIETPFHSIQLADMSNVEIGEVIWTYKQRILQLVPDPGIQYVQVFKNHGASAGASMTHSHSQIIALPIIPPLVSYRFNSMKQFFQDNRSCLLCGVTVQDLLIHQSKNFSAIVPFASAFPFEMWILPRHHSSHFHDIDRDKAVDLGQLLKLMLRKMSLQLNDPPFNFMIHTSPVQLSASDLPYSHWFIQIVPQLTGVAGFEIGSGCHINPVFPEDAAKILREVNVPMND